VSRTRCVLDPPRRVPGIAVFLNPTPDTTPHALLHSLKHYRVLHEQVIFLTVEFRDVPWVPADERVVITRFAHGCVRIRLRFGFMNRPDVISAMELVRAQGLDLDPMQTSFFLSREKILPTEEGQGMALWRDRLFAAMARNAGSVSDFFNIPTSRVVELGTQVEI
jgi:KUP system potassium uptake protein